MCVHLGSLNTVLFMLFTAQNCSQDLGFISLLIIAGLLRNTRLLAALCFVVKRKNHIIYFGRTKHCHRDLFFFFFLATIAAQKAVRRNLLSPS